MSRPSVSPDISTISIQPTVVFSLLLSVLMIVISSNDSKWNSWVDNPVDPSAGCSTVLTSMYRKTCWRTDVFSLYRSAVLTRTVEIPGAILTAVRSRLRPDDKDLQKRRNELLSTVFRIQDRNDRNLRDWNTHIDISAGMLRSPEWQSDVPAGALHYACDPRQVLANTSTIFTLLRISSCFLFFSG